MKTIPLSGGLFAKVSDEDYERLNSFKWFATGRASRRYAARMSGRSVVYMHHEVLETKLIREHHDGDSLNNTRDNLRPATQSQNLQNAKVRVDNMTGFKGVSWDTYRKQYRANIRLNNKQVQLGRFKTAVEAARAYDKAAILHFGEFARTNKMEGKYD